MTQLVELLGLAEAMADDEPVVVITVRPDPNCFHPHNIALKKAQAVRLLRDLESLLKVPAMFLVASLAVVACGCSARVEVERAGDTSATGTEISSTEFGRTAVELDFQPRSPQPVPQPKPPPVRVTPEPQPTAVTNNIVVIKGGDTHNETHIHVHDAPQRYVEETVVTGREVQAEYRPVDPRCEQLRREHEERVRTWMAFPLGE